MDKDKNSITNYFYEASSMTISHNDKKCLFFKGDDKFELVFNELKATTQNAHDMPAFGVSIHNDTIDAKESSTWIELNFDSPQEFNEMPFESLLFEIKPEDQGFNLIRKVNGKYDGRCFYLNLNSNMKNLYDVLIKIFFD